VSGPGENKPGNSKGFVEPHPKSQAANVSADGTDVYVNRAVLSDDDCANHVSVMQKNESSLLLLLL